MTNFFNNSQSPFSRPIEVQYDDLKDNYKQIFMLAADQIRAEGDKFKPGNPCINCLVKNCNIEEKDVFTTYPSGCSYRDWQIKIISFLTGDYRQKLKQDYKAIMEKKLECECSRCGNCCRLATSEHSYDQLKQRALRGDKFAKDFVSVFVPYKSDEDAKLANPEFFKLIEDTMEDQKIYYYYCPKLQGNDCSDYESRPAICKDFPHNPLKLLPSTCAFNAWKNAVAKQSMLLKAKTDIIEFYKEKLG